jgi:hypothetical protein
MTRPVSIPQAEWDRALRAAMKLMPVGSFKIVVENGHPAILPVDPASPPMGADNDDWVGLAGEAQDHGRA